MASQPSAAAVPAATTKRGWKRSERKAMKTKTYMIVGAFR